VTSTKIDINKPRYPQDHFLGRLKHFLMIIDPRTLFATDTKIKQSIKILDDYQKYGTVPNNDINEIWEAKKIKDTTIHPQTGEKIFPLFRMSCFVPSNIIICAGLLAPGLMNQVFWQWINQSYNVCVNHANRNASNPMSNEELITNYVVAVSSSCLTAIGMSKGVEKARFLSPAAKNILGMFVPFTAVAVAGIINVFMMRQNEIKKGVDIQDSEGIVYGKSKIAGWRGLLMVSFNRILVSLPVLTLVPAAFSVIKKSKFAKNYPRLVTPIHLVLITSALWMALPCAIALFPQEFPISTSKLEPEFQNLKDKNGKKIETLYFNKGL